MKKQHFLLIPFLLCLLVGCQKDNESFVAEKCGSTCRITSITETTTNANGFSTSTTEAFTYVADTNLLSKAIRSDGNEQDYFWETGKVTMEFRTNGSLGYLVFFLDESGKARKADGVNYLNSYFYTITYKYNSSGYVVQDQYEYSTGQRDTFFTTWEDGNIKRTRRGPEIIEYERYEDLKRDCSWNLFPIFGKFSKNLVKRKKSSDGTEETFTYSMDSSGKVLEINILRMKNGETTTVNTKYEYECP